MAALVACGTKSTGNKVSDGAETLMEESDSVIVDDEQKDCVGTDADMCGTDEKATVVKLLRPTITRYYNEATGELCGVSDTLSPGYYNYESEIQEYYLVCLGQDSPYTIPKKDSEIVTLTAAQGHGYVLLMNESLTTVLLKAEPSNGSKTIESFPDPEGIPEDAECLGVCGEWYKVKRAGKIGYVRRAESQWNINSADACGLVR